jgi:hypothetical protein
MPGLYGGNYKGLYGACQPFLNPKNCPETHKNTRMNSSKSLGGVKLQIPTSNIQKKIKATKHRKLLRLNCNGVGSWELGAFLDVGC